MHGLDLTTLKKITREAFQDTIIKYSVPPNDQDKADTTSFKVDDIESILEKASIENAIIVFEKRLK